jgi:hypothetical protein
VSAIAGMLGGRGPTIAKAARSLSKANSVLTKNRLEGRAETRIDLLREEIAALEATVDPTRLEERTILPAKGDVKILRYDVVWVY